MKPYALYIMLGFAIILDFLSLIMIMVANGPGFVIGVLGFLNSAVFISTHTVAFLAHVAKEENKISQAAKKEQNSMVKKQMTKAQSKLVDSIKSAYITVKMQQLAFAGLSGVVSSIPVLGSFVPAHTISAIAAIAKHYKLDKIIRGWTGKIAEATKSVRQAGRSFGGGGTAPVAASRRE